MPLLKDFIRHFQSLGIDPGKGGVLVACSGGADSMVLAELCRSAGFLTALAHVNYQLRGPDSDADEQLVQQYAFSHNLLFYSTAFDTQTIARQWGKGIQESARILRYGWLEELRNTHGYAAILTAHHADDEAETTLLRLLSGSGLTAIQGIAPVLGTMARPLLPYSKKRLLAFAADRQIPFREDASNLSDDYLRNKIRHHILPPMEAQFPDAVRLIQQATHRLQDAAHYYRKAMDKERRKLLRTVGPDLYLPVRALRLRPGQPTLLFELLRSYGFTYSQTTDIAALLEAESGKEVSSASHRIFRHRDHLILTPLKSQESNTIPIPSWPAEIAISSAVLHFREGSPPAVFSLNPAEAWLSSKALEQPLVLRRVRTGDYFYPIGMGLKKKKVLRFLSDQKVPKHLKEDTWVLESNRRIAWVVGYRIDERFKVKPGVERALHIRLSAASGQPTAGLQ